jgi:nucleoside-diphosphate-sugar epimerase
MSDASSNGRLLVLGADGPTGRQIVRQALNRGYRVAAPTRHPEGFPIQPGGGSRRSPARACTSAPPRCSVGKCSDADPNLLAVWGCSWCLARVLRHLAGATG